MKNKLLNLAVLGLLLGGCRCSRTAETPTPPAAPVVSEQTFALTNGLAVELVSGPCSDQAGIAVLVRGGVDHDPVKRSGLAQLAGRLLGGTGRTVVVGSDSILYSVGVPTARVLAELDAVAAWMGSAPAEADVGRARTALLEDLSKPLTDAGATARRHVEEVGFPVPADGRRAGVAADLQSVTAGDLQAFWLERMRPGNARLVVAGQFDAAAAKVRIESAFSTLPAGTPPVLRDPPGPVARGTLVMTREPSLPRALAIGVPVPGMKEPTLPAFLVLAARLAASAQPPRTWSVDYDPVHRPEVLFVTATIAPGEPAEPAAAKVRAEVDAVLAQALAPTELAAARTRFRHFLDPQLGEPVACGADAGAVAIARARRAHLDVPASLGQDVEKVTAAQVGPALRRFEVKQTTAVIAEVAGPSRDSR